MGHFPGIRQMLHELLATPSVSCVSPDCDMGNLAVTEKLADWLETLGFHCEILPLVNDSRKANLVATLGRGSGGLILAGHTDTVPFDAQLWSHEPLGLTEADNRFYGMGIADMKGFFALAIEAARAFQAGDLREPLTIVATADEESSMDGARELATSGRLRARHVIIGEPTGLRPVHMHKGMMMEAVRLLGRAGHSSDPALGANALEGMNLVISELLKWREDLQQRYRDDSFRVPVPTLNPGRIFGGDNPNRICGQCELHFDLRTLPGMPEQSLMPELQQRLQRVIAGRGLELHMQPLMQSLGAFAAAPDSELVKAAEQLTGVAAEAAAYATEAPFFAACGLNALVLGPGDIDQAHQPDEYLALDRVQPTVDLLRAMITRFCT
jgi:acetylornithine deacetylase